MVQLGCERLFEDPRAFRLVRGRRVGLVTNPSGVDRRLRATADLLHVSPGPELVLLFGPEHGIRGDAEDGVPVETAIDDRTGVPAVSLYGERRQPSPGELEQLDVLLFDIQDVGVRFYTYLYTMSLAMEACAEAGVPFVVLDRPNPLGGLVVEGNMLDAPAFASFVGRYPIPVRYGLTIGELARLFNEEFGIGAELHVVEMRGWRRSMHWPDTSLHWVPPSPNMPTPETVAVYPGMCFFEGTNVSEGRGTALPFEQIGAPYMDGFVLAARIDALGLPASPSAPSSSGLPSASTRAFPARGSSCTPRATRPSPPCAPASTCSPRRGAAGRRTSSGARTPTASTTSTSSPVRTGPARPWTAAFRWTS